jgi:ribonuclease HI
MIKESKTQQLFKGASGKLVIFTDGGARGNPGPAAIGVLVGGKEYSEYVGEKTNNQAEYEAVIFALRKAKQLLGKKKAKEAEIEVRADSELIVRQLNGRYKILERELQSLFLAAWNLRLDFKEVEFKHVRREQNRQADLLVNRELDSRRKL